MIISRKIDEGVKPLNCVEQVRGTFGQDERFRDYQINSLVRTNPSVGPGNYNAIENFRKQKFKNCRVIMRPDFRPRDERSDSGQRARSAGNSGSSSHNSSTRNFIRENIEGVHGLTSTKELRPFLGSRGSLGDSNGKRSNSSKSRVRGGEALAQHPSASRS